MTSGGLTELPHTPCHLVQHHIFVWVEVMSDQLYKFGDSFQKLGSSCLNEPIVNFPCPRRKPMLPLHHPICRLLLDMVPGSKHSLSPCTTVSSYGETGNKRQSCLGGDSYVRTGTSNINFPTSPLPNPAFLFLLNSDAIIIVRLIIRFPRFIPYMYGDLFLV